MKASALMVGLLVATPAWCADDANDDEVQLCRDEDGPLMYWSIGHWPLRSNQIRIEKDTLVAYCDVNLKHPFSPKQIKDWENRCIEYFKHSVRLLAKCNTPDNQNWAQEPKLVNSTIVDARVQDTKLWQLQTLVTSKPSNQPLHPDALTRAGERQR